MTRWLLVLLVGLWPATLDAADHRDAKWLKLGLILSIGCQSADLYSTALVIGSGRGREANPVLGPLMGHPYAAGLVVGSTRAGVSWYLLNHHARHPRLTLGLAWASAAASCYVASRNGRIYERRGGVR